MAEETAKISFFLPTGEELFDFRASLVDFYLTLCRKLMRTLTYLAIFLFVALMLVVLPKDGGGAWAPRIIVPATAALFTLLVWLIARFIGTDDNALDLVVTAFFIILFAPGSQIFFSLDEGGIIELCSQCIVPFFLTQYTRISRKNFKTAYALMLLMGIFCSFTHDGITLPLCLAFLALAWQRRADFFRLACWPMVAGWLVGTILQFATRDRLPSLTPDFDALTSRTALILGLLWDTKVFVFALGLTVWLTTVSWGRGELLRLVKRQRLITYSLIFALSLVPFAPLGIDNAVTSVCFFSMLWALLIVKRLEQRYVGAARARKSL